MPTEPADFRKLRVASFESRRAPEIARLIERTGGEAFVSPSMREVPLADPRPAIEFAGRLITGQIDVLVLLTGVGLRQLVEQVERHVGRQRFIDAVSDVTTVARGPKPTAALRELGLQPTFRVPEPNTWRELLATLDLHVPLANQTVGLQEYGITNPSLIAGLEARGATVDRVQVYEWDFPEDIGPLEANARRWSEGELDVAMFTSANQVRNLMKLADDLGLRETILARARQMVIASIGPTTSEALRDEGLPVDLEASPPNMGTLVQLAARESHALLARKQRVLAWRGAPLDPDKPGAESQNSVFMRACRGEPTPYTPVWLMRQAGRYMPEYRAVRAKTGFLELCRNPQLCSEVMCTAVDFLKVDAAIIFSDLLPILEPMGLELEFAQGDGPVIHNPVREGSDVDRVLDLDSVDSLSYVIDTVRQTRADLPAAIPLIGFAGAPFTLASYAIEGGSSRHFLHTKLLMYRDRGAWDALMGRLSRAVVIYLNAQIAAGAQAVQLFDSWIGCLGPDDYLSYVAPHMQQLIEGLTPGVPVIHFGTGNPELLGPMSSAGGDVIGVDWRIGLDQAWQRIEPGRSVQGNLDPHVLLADRDTIRRRTQDVLDEAAGRPGHIFNLGHGVLQQTPPDNARALVEMVHELSSR
jgi:uroporphyrinogen decarboxylase